MQEDNEGLPELASDLDKPPQRPGAHWPLTALLD